MNSAAKTSTTIQEKINAHLGAPDHAGHVAWSGKTTKHGAPLVRHAAKDHQVSHLIFEQRYGRKPIGMCRAGCGVAHCLNADHLEDDLTRRTVRLQLRALHGWAAPWDICPKGLHQWAEDGRVEPDLTIYCRGCNTDRARKSRTAKTKG